MTPHPLNGADDRLPAGVGVNVFDSDLLLPLAAIYRCKASTCIA